MNTHWLISSEAKAVCLKSEHNLFMFKLTALVMMGFANTQVCKSGLVLGFLPLHLLLNVYVSQMQMVSTPNWSGWTLQGSKGLCLTYRSCHSFGFLIAQGLFVFFFPQTSSVVHQGGKIKFKNFPKSNLLYTLPLLLPSHCSAYF